MHNFRVKALSSHVSANNLGVMCDALQELSKLSLKLQTRESTIILAHRAICREDRVQVARLLHLTHPGELRTLSRALH